MVEIQNSNNWFFDYHMMESCASKQKFILGAPLHGQTMSVMVTPSYVVSSTKEEAPIEQGWDEFCPVCTLPLHICLFNCTRLLEVKVYMRSEWMCFDLMNMGSGSTETTQTQVM